ncbi:unnamed protein product [Brachionus calyciflorus]|uniref:Right handed beta helix domain-containing protein n=1 Tax=Brachionus calyciflorus TaxID=104777 RepID=A0A814C1U0_9BILA|nr:unnamed protein product [Brachionus calyciflorus]
MKLFVIFSIIALTRAVEISVSTLTQLKNALTTVQPGDIIRMADGTYDGTISITRSGTAAKPITLIGSKQAYIVSTGYGIHLKANYWILKGFSVKNCKKGIVTDSANFNVFDNLAIHHINEEAVHFRTASSDNTIKNSVIKYTGLTNPGVGEGVYIGSSLSHWVNGQPDLSHRNKVLNNRFGPNVSAEAIDIKEGSESNLIQGNIFDGVGMSGANYADSWIDVKGAKNIIANNTGTYSLLDGFQIHKVDGSVTNSACNNEFTNNVCSKLGSGGVCVNLYKITCTNKNLNNKIV